MDEHVRDVSRLVKAAVVVLLVGASPVLAETQQQQVHRMSHMVMPFDMAKTLHIFRMTDSGGVQQVVARDASDSDQIPMIRQHLAHEAQRFGHGDFSDPAMLHGADMPGLRELRAGASDIKVTYEALPLGARITFETADLHLITAIHRWFGAQLSEHGADARAE